MKLISGLTAGGVDRGAECPSGTSDQEISADLPGKERQGKMEKKRRKTKKEGFLFCFVFFFLLFTFQNHRNLFWVYQNVNFLPGKKSISCREKKSGKMTLPPLKNIPLVNAPEIDDEYL